MSTSLSFLFDQDGKLKPEFQRCPKPIDGEPTIYKDRGYGRELHVHGDTLDLRIRRWEDMWLDRIPDWEKVEQAIFGTAPWFKNMRIHGDQPQETAGAGIPESPGVLMPSLGAIHGGLPDPPLQEYTVILQDIEGAITWRYPWAASPEEAVEQAEDACTVSIACIPGHHSNLAP